MRYITNTLLTIIIGFGVSMGLASRVEALPTSLSFGPINFDRDGPAVGAGVATVDTFFFRPGNALAIGVVPAYADHVNNGITTPFDTILQTSLASMQDTITPLPPINMPAGEEITMVIRAPQRIFSVVGATTTSILDAGGPNNSLELWYHSAANADDLAGSGFNDGTLILSAFISTLTSTIVTGVNSGALDQAPTTPPIDDYPGITTLGLGGGATFLATVNFVDPNFFMTQPLAVAFSTTFSAPFTLADPSALLDGTSPNIGSVNGLSGPDIQFQSTSELTFAVPEPATISLFVLGAFGLILRRSRDAAGAKAGLGGVCLCDELRFRQKEIQHEPLGAAGA